MYTKKLTATAVAAEKAVDALLANVPADYQELEAGIDEISEMMKRSIANAESDYDPALPTFYLSNDGDDAADGKTPETAWKTLDKINTPGTTPEHCNILLRRGDVFRGSVIPPHEYITYSAYGTGKKPCVYGSLRNYADPSLWEPTEYKNVWRTTACGRNIGMIAFNHSDEYGRYDEVMGFRSIIGVNGFTGPQDLWRNYEFWSNLAKNELYLFCAYGNPGSVFSSIEIGEWMSVFCGGSHIKLDNICVKFTGAHGVGIGDCVDYTVQNCVFAYLGGSILMGFRGGNKTGYGNAIQVFGGCDGYYVNGNWIYQIYDTAITHQFSGSRRTEPTHMKDVEYIGNLCEYCHWSLEYYNTLNIQSPEIPRTVKNVNMSHNVMRNACYGWGSIGREETGSTICSCGLPPQTENFEVRSNILDRSAGGMVQLQKGGDEKIITSDNLFIQKEGRPFGYCYGQAYMFSKDGAADCVKNLFHDASAKVVFSES